MGDDLTMADFFAYYILVNTRIIAKRMWRWDILADIDGLSEWMIMMSQRPFIKLFDDERAVEISNMWWMEAACVSRESFSVISTHVLWYLFRFDTTERCVIDKRKTQLTK